MLADAGADVIYERYSHGNCWVRADDRTLYCTDSQMMDFEEGEMVEPGIKRIRYRANGGGMVPLKPERLFCARQPACFALLADGTLWSFGYPIEWMTGTGHTPGQTPNPLDPVIDPPTQIGDAGERF